jgi:energy-coupling factor transport system permease protein
MSFLLTPLLSSVGWRLALVVLLFLLTVTAAIPWRVWRQQMGWLLVLCLLLLGITALMPDGMAVNYQPRLPKDELAFAQQAANLPASPSPAATQAPELPQPTPYQYVLFQQGNVRVTQQSLGLALRVSSLLFTLMYSTNLYLLTTAPEEITAGLEYLLQPLKRLKLPIPELVLILTLSLRFIPLVLEEIQNLTRAVRTRAINWKKLGYRGVLKIWFMLADRLLQNLFLRAEQIAGAMQVRGFTNVEDHRSQWHPLQLQRWDLVALAVMAVLWGLRFAFGNP